MTQIPASDASILGTIAENPEQARARASDLLGQLSSEAAQEIAQVLLADPSGEVPASEDARTTADALRRWAASNKIQKNHLAVALAR
jgi:hypothetical protein